MKVIETFLMGKEKEIRLCEDGFIVTEDYAVMIDGAGTPSPMVFKGNKGGRYIMELIRDNICYLDTELDYLSFLDEISKIILQDYRKNGWYELLKEDVTLRPMASMVVYSKKYHQLWFYGDCKALVGNVQYENPKFIDEVMTNARKMILEAELLLGKEKEKVIEEDKGREYINTLLDYQRLFLHLDSETTLAFSMIDGFDFRKQDIKIIDLPKNLEYLVLATDGYSILKSTLKETEEVLKEQLDKDALAINELKGFKTYSNNLNSVDDRAYIKIRF